MQQRSYTALHIQKSFVSWAEYWSRVCAIHILLQVCYPSPSKCTSWIRFCIYFILNLLLHQYVCDSPDASMNAFSRRIIIQKQPSNVGELSIHRLDSAKSTYSSIYLNYKPLELGFPVALYSYKREDECMHVHGRRRNQRKIYATLENLNSLDLS